jgi:hypothetical protein
MRGPSGTRHRTWMPGRMLGLAFVLGACGGGDSVRRNHRPPGPRGDGLARENTFSGVTIRLVLSKAS